MSVVIPTYCEAANLPLIVPRVHRALAGAGYSYEVIVVDDDSPDGTKEVCYDLSEEYPLRLIIREEERGLSSAVIEGMRSARGSVLVCMDADLSHPPERLPALIAALDEPGADFVIGSRHVDGASTDETWSLLRRLNSWVATCLARPLSPARDPMAGYFALRAQTFDQAQDLNPIGYKIGLELYIKCRCEGLREVPIHFNDRVHGESKLNVREQVNYLVHVARLLHFKYGFLSRVVRFGMVGASGAVIDILTFLALLGPMSLAWARAIAVGVAMTWNFFGHRYVTFDGRQKGRVLGEYVRFLASCGAGGVVNWATSMLLCTSVEAFAVRPWMGAVAGVVAGAAVNFWLCSKVVFPHQRGLAENAQSVSPEAQAHPES